MKYHSALHKPNSYDSLNRAEFGKSVAFKHDLMLGVPDEYKNCDIIYTEIPWIDGFNVFEQRANVQEQRTYAAFMSAVCNFINTANKPTVIIIGKKGLKFLPTPDFEGGTILNGAPCRVVTYKATITQLHNCVTIIDELSKKYDCIGDPCCGFGRSAKAFKQAGKHFVVSDYNPECIGYIAKEWVNW